MSFHPSYINRKRNLFYHQYHLHGHPLKSTKETKYLGVLLSDDLRWDSHITNVTNKASKTLGFLRRNRKGGSMTIKEQAYKALARPTLEFRGPAWDPYTVKNINKLEAVQRRATRYMMLHWRPLKSRRMLTTFFKHSHGERWSSTPTSYLPPNHLQDQHDRGTMTPTIFRHAGLPAGKLFFPSNHCRVELSSDRGGECPLDGDLQIQDVATHPPPTLLPALPLPPPSYPLPSLLWLIIQAANCHHKTTVTAKLGEEKSQNPQKDEGGH